MPSIWHHGIVPAARTTDPATSHAAASRAKSFSFSHGERILSALSQSVVLAAQPGEVGLTAEQISYWTRLSVVQIDRRLPELERAGKVRLVKDQSGRVLERNGFRVWEATYP